MAKKLATAPERSAGRRKCCHHWIIEDDVSAPTSKGVCQLCGAQRHFVNHCKQAATAEESEDSAQKAGRRWQKGAKGQPKETIMAQVERLFDMVSDVEDSGPEV